MSKFEFTITIVSIVIAFALSELMAGWGRILRHRPRPRIDLLFAAWSVGILLLAVLHWSGLWLYASVPFESLPQLFALLAPPLLLVPLAFLLSPEPKADGVLDLGLCFREVSRPTLFLLAAFTILSLLADVTVGSVSPFSVEIASSLGFVGFFDRGGRSEQRKARNRRLGHSLDLDRRIRLRPSRGTGLVAAPPNKPMKLSAAGFSRGERFDNGGPPGVSENIVHVICVTLSATRIRTCSRRTTAAATVEP